LYLLVAVAELALEDQLAVLTVAQVGRVELTVLQEQLIFGQVAVVVAYGTEMLVDLVVQVAVVAQ
jgi:hypothetical protein